MKGGWNGIRTRKAQDVELDPHDGQFLFIINNFIIFILILLFKLFQFPPSLWGFGV